MTCKEALWAVSEMSERQVWRMSTLTEDPMLKRICLMRIEEKRIYAEICGYAGIVAYRPTMTEAAFNALRDRKRPSLRQRPVKHTSIHNSISYAELQRRRNASA